MSWDQDSLWAKGCVFFERAFNESKEDPMFGLWAALGLELLARAAVSSVSPTLLSEPDRDHKYLLHVLERGSERVPKRTIGSAVVLQLCSTLFDEFSDEDKKVCTAIINRRNEELHTGTAAFIEYPSSAWLSGFLRSCKALCECQGKTLEDLVGEEEAANALELLAEERAGVQESVKSTIAAHKKVFEAKTAGEQELAQINAEAQTNALSYQGHHKVACPACSSAASISGVLYGEEQLSHSDGEVQVRQPVSPRDFLCPACSLSLNGYAKLEVIGMGGRHTRTSTYTLEEYYGLVDPNTFSPEYEYDNE